MRKITAFFLVILLLLSLASCNGEVTSHSFEISETTSADEEKTVKLDFKHDTEIPSDAVYITLEEDSASIEGDGAECSGTVLTIVSEGCYVLSGVFYGTLHINAPETEKVHIVLDGAEIYSEDYSAIYAESAKKVKLTLKEGSENSFSDGTSYVTEAGSEPNACIFADCDLIVNGEGKMSILANCNNAVSTDDDLTIVSGKIEITASKNALKGKDGVEILGGTVNIRGAKDGIKSDGTDTDKGRVKISGGEISITCSDDAIQAEHGVTISDCKISANAGDNIIDCEENTEIDYSCIENLNNQ